MSVPVDAPVWRPLLCPDCARYLGVAEAQNRGKIKVHCRTCREYKLIDLDADQPRRNGDDGQPLRLIGGED